MNTEQKIEAFLFYRGEPVSRSVLLKTLDINAEEFEQGIVSLRNNLLGRGIALMEANGEYELRTAPEAGAMIEGIRKDELSKDLGKAGMETLSIILYKGPISRSSVDYIRGVNSSFIIRNLLIRGLIDRIPNPTDERSFLYRPTMDLISFMGVSRVEDLPEYATVQSELNKIESNTDAS